MRILQVENSSHAILIELFKTLSGPFYNLLSFLFLEIREKELAFDA